MQWERLSDAMYEGTPSATIQPQAAIYYWFGFTGVMETGNLGSTNHTGKEQYQRPALKFLNQIS